MSAYTNKKVYVILTLLVLLAVSFLSFLVITGFSNLKNAPSNLTTQSELSQFPIDYNESNSLIVVCPKEARNNPNYPDASCKKTTYFGTNGIYEAISKGGKEHTVFLKNGRYKGPLYINNEKRYLTIAGESRDGVIFYRDYFDKSLQDQPVISIDGDGGYTIDNITVTVPSDLLGYNNYYTVGIKIGKFSAVTIKNVLVYNTYAGVYLQPGTQDIKIYKSIFVNNINGVVSKTDSKVKFLNNIFAYNINLGLLLDLRSYGVQNQFSGTVSEKQISSFLYKKLENNLFYNNKVAIKATVIPKVDLLNNLFSKNVDRDIEVTSQFSKDLENFYSASTGRSLFIRFNFTDNNASKFCSYYQKTLFGNYTSCKNFEKGPNKSGIGNNIFVKTDISSGEFNFRLSDGSNLIDAGDPSISDRDGTRSDPGAYGGYCYYDSDGCDDLQFPLLNTLPDIKPGDSDDFDASKLDNNNDGKVDILDIINLIKYVFGG